MSATPKGCHQRKSQISVVMRIRSFTTPHRVTSLLSLIVSVFVISAATTPSLAQHPARVTSSFDRDWLFLECDAAGAERPAFNDSGWRKLDVPHDWSIEGPADE